MADRKKGAAADQAPLWFTAWSKGMTMEELKNEIVEMKGLHGKLATKVEKHDEKIVKLEKEVAFLSKTIRERNSFMASHSTNQATEACQWKRKLRNGSRTH